MRVNNKKRSFGTVLSEVSESPDTMLLSLVYAYVVVVFKNIYITSSIL